VCITRAPDPSARVTFLFEPDIRIATEIGNSAKAHKSECLFEQRPMRGLQLDDIRRKFVLRGCRTGLISVWAIWHDHPMCLAIYEARSAYRDIRARRSSASA